LSAVDLYLAHLFADDESFGTNATASFLKAEKQNAGQASIEVIRQIYSNDAVRMTFLKRNKAIFKDDGSATVAESLKACTDALARGFEEVRKLGHRIQEEIPSNSDDPIFNGQFSGKVISVSDEDVDALARVGESEVGNFGTQFGDDELTRALGAVIDTVFNRTVYPTTEFPKTIQGVINQKQQFSAINDIGTWQRLPKAPQKHFEIVLNYIHNRARGSASEIKGATHFFNPDTSNPAWGQPIREHPTATFGRPKNSHIHGFPKGYHPPEGYAIQLGKDATVFAGDGQPQGLLITPDKSVASILAAADKEWKFWGSSTPLHIGHTDKELAFAIYVRDNYCKPLSASPPLTDIQGDKYAWSAVTISYFVRQAGISSSEFTFAQSHSVYIREAIKARNDHNRSKAYWGFRLTEPEAVVQPGDIIGRGRSHGMTFSQAQALFDRQDDYESHSDLVVAVRAGVADLLGGNVSDSVTKRTIALNPQGKVADTASLAFVVMKKN
jgi:spore germination cell wall hydrolase CwlJ-like protein